ncbi:MAG TPA: hypothetical protein VI232_24785 [Reyranella sp.]|jgi:hypothetical protein
MRTLLLALVAVGFAGAAGAQSKSAPAGMMGTAGVKTHLEALHYKDVHDLRRGPDGQWIAKATQGNVEKSVTVSPQGDVIAR